MNQLQVCQLTGGKREEMKMKQKLFKNHDLTKKKIKINVQNAMLH